MASLVQWDRDDIVEALLLGPGNDGPRMPQTSEEEAVLLGDELEPQEAQKFTTSSPEYPETPEPEEQTEQFDTLSPPALSPTASNSHGYWYRNTRRAWHKARPQHPPTPNPDSPTTGSGHK